MFNWFFKNPFKTKYEKHEIETINLFKYYLAILGSIILSFFLVLFLNKFFQLEFIWFMIFTLGLSFLFIFLGKNTYKNNVTIQVKSNSLFFVFESEKIDVNYKEVKSYKIKVLASNFPLFKIQTFNGNVVSFGAIISMVLLKNFLKNLKLICQKTIKFHP